MASAALLLLGLGLLVVIHEVGHAVAARLAGLRLTDFSIGLGPSVLARRLGGVTLRLGVVPFGGFVRVAELAPAGEAGPDGEPDASCGRGHAPAGARGHARDPRGRLPSSEPGRFSARQTAARLAAILAGSGANLLLAGAIAGGLALGYGVETGRVVGLEVTATSGPALRLGDVLTGVEGRPVRRVSELSALLGSRDGAPVRVAVRRQGRAEVLTLSPRRAGDRWGLGARYVARPELRRASALEALGRGAAFPFEQARVLVSRGLRSITPGSGVRQVTAVGLSDRVSRTGRWDLRRALGFAAVLSVVVGLWNLLPVPGLDGGRLCLEVVESVGRRRLPRAAAVGVQVGGALVLLAIWAALLARDALGLLS